MHDQSKMFFDFETFSAAGYALEDGIFGAKKGVAKKGIGLTGAYVYAEHPSTRVLCVCYAKDNEEVKIWAPVMGAMPRELTHHEGVYVAHNARFEYLIWNFVCTRLYGVKPLDYRRLNCTAIRSRSYSLPPSLSNVAEFLNVGQKKLSSGAHLIQKLCVPNPRSAPSIKDVSDLFEYCKQDVQTLRGIDRVLPELSMGEVLDSWLDWSINSRGVKVDLKGLNDAHNIYKQAIHVADCRIPELTGGIVQSATQVSALRLWIMSQGVKFIPDLSADTVDELLLDANIRGNVQEVLKIRQIISSSSCRKIPSIIERASKDGRIKDCFLYRGAVRTGRFSSRGVQLHNLKRTGISYKQCGKCNVIFESAYTCGACGTPAESLLEHTWDIHAADAFIGALESRNLTHVSSLYPNIASAIGGSIRNFFIADDNKQLICSDYSAIEAVVLAALSGETWRLEVFRTHGKIYEMSASRFTGTPIDEFFSHKTKTGSHHPSRTLGKIAELSLGYQGGLMAAKRMGMGKYLSDDEIRMLIKRWREESPNIVKFWGGQASPYKMESGAAPYSGIEGAVICAIHNKGKTYRYRDIAVNVSNDTLFIWLPSGRALSYHHPEVHEVMHPQADYVVKRITYQSHIKMVKPSDDSVVWKRDTLYGGKITENITQAVACDIFINGMHNVERAGYPVVMHIHDEIVAEVDIGFGSIEEFEHLMCVLPVWAKDYPIKASGGWIGKRYRK